MAETPALLDARYDVFQSDKVDVSSTSQHTSVLTPVNGLENPGTIQFTVPRLAIHWMDVCNAYFRVEVQLMKHDAAKGADVPCEATDKAIIINNTAHSLFSDITIRLNERTIEGGNDLYYLRAYLSNLLQYTNDVKNTHMVTQGFTVPQVMHDTEYDAATKTIKTKAVEFTDKENALNQAILKQWSDNKFKRTFDFPLKCNLFQQVIALPPGMQLDLIFTLNKPEYAIYDMEHPAGTTSTKYKFKITSFQLYMPMLTPNAELQLKTANRRKTEAIYYRYNGMTVQRQTIESGVQKKTFSNVAALLSPKLIFFAVVPSNSWFDPGSRKLYFERHGLSQVTMTTNGAIMTGGTINCKDDVIAYSQFNRAIQVYNTNESCGIDLESFTKYCYFIAFDCTLDKQIDSVQPTNTRQYGLELQFENTTTQNLDLLMFVIHDEQFSVTPENAVISSAYIPPAI